MHHSNPPNQMAYVAQPQSPNRVQHSNSPGLGHPHPHAQAAYSLMPTYSPPVAYHRMTHNASPPLEVDGSVVRPLALRRHTSPQQQYATHLMVPPQHHNAPPMYHPNQAQYHRQVYLPHSPTPVSPSPSSPTLSIVPQFASDDDESGSGSGSGSAPSNHGGYVAMAQAPSHSHYGHPAHHMQMMQPVTHYAMPVTQMRQITHVAVPTMQAQPTPAGHTIIQHAPHMQQHHPHPHMMHPSQMHPSQMHPSQMHPSHMHPSHMHPQMHPSHHPYQQAHPGGFVMIAAPPSQHQHPHQHPQMHRIPMHAVPQPLSDDHHSGTKPKGSKRTATQMREFVRSYFANHSSSLVNKDLSTISHELQVAYEREFPSHCMPDIEQGKDRKPVFCRTFIQKVARQMGFLLTLNYGLVDKRMKHLMKIRKRGKKAKKSDGAAAAADDNADEIQPGAEQEAQQETQETPQTQMQVDIAVKSETNHN